MKFKDLLLNESKSKLNEVSGEGLEKQLLKLFYDYSKTVNGDILSLDTSDEAYREITKFINSMTDYVDEKIAEIGEIFNAYLGLDYKLGVQGHDNTNVSKAIAELKKKLKFVKFK